MVSPSMLIDRARCAQHRDSVRPPTASTSAARRRRARVRTPGAVRPARKTTSSWRALRTAVLIPAHNEERLIGATLRSLLNQTVPADQIVVVADNCTDSTAAIARALGVHVVTTVGNRAKKAGALNQGFAHVRGADYIIQADADISFDEKFVAELVAALSCNPDAGAVAARVGVQPFPGGGPVSWLLWLMQRLEYYYYDSMKVEARGRVWCVSGIGGIYRGEVLRSIAGSRPGPWDEASIVEDYSLTLDIEDAGWRTGSAMGAFAWSDTMPALLPLWRQRMRWNMGTLIEWQRRERTRPVRMDRAAFRRGLALTAVNPIFITLTVLAWLVAGFALSPWSLLVTAVFAVERLWRLRYVPRRRIADYVVALAVLPELVYRLILDANLWWARARTIRRRHAAELAW